MNRSRGFTLIEVSVVLVIIGLIMGGIVVGQSLIHSSELQSTLANLQHYKNAVQTFREKYNALPGDMPNAENIWGSDSGCPGTSFNTIPKAATCNGNGDGVVFGNVYGVDYNERFRFWQQLANAGLIDGQYTGVHGPAGATNHVPGLNAPGSAYPATVWSTIGYTTPNLGTASVYPFPAGNLIELRTSINDTAAYAAIVPEDAYLIDIKIDDGLPGTGNVLTYKTSVEPGCATSDDPSTATYNTTNKNPTCSLIFLNAY